MKSMSRTEFIKLLETYLEAIESQDIEKIAEFFTEDATVIIPGAPPYKGKEAIMGLYKEILDPDSEIEHEIIKTIIDEKDAAVAVDVKIAYRDGRKTEFSEVNIFKVRGDKISRVQVFFDTPLAVE